MVAMFYIVPLEARGYLNGNFAMNSELKYLCRKEGYFLGLNIRVRRPWVRIPEARNLLKGKLWNNLNLEEHKEIQTIV